MLTSEQRREILRRRVLRGVMTLDLSQPGWRDRVNRHELSLRDCKACVLGQLFGHYHEGNAALRRPPFDWRLGFNGNDYQKRRMGRQSDQLDVLQELWLEQLTSVPEREAVPV